MFALVRKYVEKRALETCFEWPRSEMRHSRRSRAAKDKVAPYQDNLDQSALKTKGIRLRKFKISHETLTKTGSTKPLAHPWDHWKEIFYKKSKLISVFDDNVIMQSLANFLERPQNRDWKKKNFLRTFPEWFGCEFSF